MTASATFGPYTHVDAFAARPLAGNQAAVMLLDGWLADATLQAIAAENMFAETAFIVPDATESADFELRWFTPAVEVAMCGHATLASGHVLLTRDATREHVRFRTRRAGVLEVARDDAGYRLSLPVVPTALAPFDAAVPLLHAPSAPLEVWRSDDGYNVFLFASAMCSSSARPLVRAMLRAPTWSAGCSCRAAG